MAALRRFSIARLMGVVLAVSLGLAALRSGSQIWASTVLLLACGALALAVVGVVFDEKGGRAWWLGFALFGWGYLALIFCPYHELPEPPTDVMLRLAAPYIGPPPPWKPGFHGIYADPYRQVGHGLCSFAAAVLGGVLAHALFGSPRAASPHPSAYPEPTGSVSSPRWRWRRVAWLAGPLFATVAITEAVNAPGQWAGATVLLTWGVLGLAMIAAVCGRRTCRPACLGATTFGVGYMLLVAGQPVAIMTDVDNRPWTQVSTNRLLNALRPWVPKQANEFPPASDGVDFANARILRALDRTVPMRFPRETPLEEVLKYIAASTQDPDGYRIPVYVDPAALRDAEQSIESPVTIDLDGVPLRTGLDLALNQLDLSYTVKGGVLVVNNEFGQIPVACNDPFLTIGQCLLALFAAGVGSVLAGRVHDSREERATRPPGGADPLLTLENE